MPDPLAPPNPKLPTMNEGSEAPGQRVEMNFIDLKHSWIWQVWDHRRGTSQGGMEDSFAAAIKVAYRCVMRRPLR